MSNGVNGNGLGSGKRKVGRSIILYLIALACVGLSIARIWLPAFDQTSAALLGLAIVALVIDQVTSFEGFGIKVNKEAIRKVVQSETASLRDDFNSDIRDMDQAISAIEKTRPTVELPKAMEAGKQKKSLGEMQRSRWDSDPHLGKFGGLPCANGRELSAKISPAAGPRSAKCLVKFEVLSTDPNKPLTGKVTVFLHPTYNDWKEYDLEVEDGVAKDEFNAWGVFTMGVVADDGKTRLELNLNDVKGGTDKFYKQ